MERLAVLVRREQKWLIVFIVFCLIEMLLILQAVLSVSSLIGFFLLVNIIPITLGGVYLWRISKKKSRMVFNIIISKIKGLKGIELECTSCDVQQNHYKIIVFSKRCSKELETQIKDIKDKTTTKMKGIFRTENLTIDIDMRDPELSIVYM